MICTLVLVAWGQSFQLGFYKACFYDCGSRRFGYYDRVYRVSPDYVCPVRLELA